MSTHSATRLVGHMGIPCYPITHGEVKSVSKIMLLSFHNIFLHTKTVYVFCTTTITKNTIYVKIPINRGNGGGVL